MASYGLKYRAEWKNTREQDYRLDIYQRGFSGSSKTIKTLCGCSLEVQGSQGDVTTPIVKTQLRFSIIDAWDIADTSTEKWGNCSEFYTPDATLYRVQLLEYTEGAWVAMWTGYITPDSWQEDLGYRTAITVTARDNIGHLKDFQFNLSPNSDGLIKIADILEGAMDTIELAMDYTVARAGLGPTSLQSITAGGVYLHNAYINAELLNGMNWYDVLERTLEATGMTLRWVGMNRVEITYLRNMPKMGSAYASPGYQTLEFYGGSLEFEPAVKQIVEEVDYKMRKDVPLEILSGLQFGASTTYRCKVDGNKMPSGGISSIPEHDAPADTVSNSGGSVWVEGYDLFDPSTRVPYDFLKRDEGVDGWRKYAMIPSNYVSSDYIRSRFKFKTRTSAVKITVNFTPHPLSIVNHGSGTGKVFAPHHSLSQIKYQVRYLSDDNSVVRYWDGASWTTNLDSVVTREYDSQNEYGTALEINLSECDDISSGTIYVCFFNIIYKMFYSGGQGVYARVQSILVELSSTRALDGNRVTTINNSAYNVLIERRPLFSALSMEMGFTTPKNYLGALFYYPSGGSTPEQYPYQVRFEAQSSSNTVPLPVIIHQQILCYRHGAARVLSGRCAPINKARWDLPSQFRYKGTTYLLQGGTIDLFSGIMEGAVFHEFLDFDDLWTGAPSYSGSTSYNTDTPGTGTTGGNSGGASSESAMTPETDPVFGASPAAGIPAVTPGDNGKVLKVANGAYALGTVETGSQVAFGSYDSTKKTVMLTVNGSTREMQQYPGQKYIFPAVLAAPIIEIRHGFTKNSPQSAIDPIIYARHPAIGRITGAQLVLMTYSQRRGRNGRKNYREGCFARKGWGAAQGKTNHAGLTWTTNAKTLLDIRQFILRNFIAIAGEAKPSSMTYAAFQAKSESAKIGFSGMYNTAAATFKSKNRRRFGIAVRWENPDWTALGLTGTIADTTTEYNNNGTRVRRWIYTDVAEFIVHVGYAYTNNAGLAKGWVIGFELKK